MNVQNWPRSGLGLVSRVLPVHTAVRNCTRDEGGPFEVGNQVLTSSQPQAAVVKSDGDERCGNAGTRFRQARLREASASKPSMKCRKRIRRCQNRGVTLVWGFFCQGVRQCNACFCPSSVFFVRSESPFLRPDPQQRQAVARRSCQGWPLHHLSTCFALARPYLDSFEHDGPLGAVGMTIRGEPAFGRGSIAPQPCIRWVQGPEP